MRLALLHAAFGSELVISIHAPRAGCDRRSSLISISVRRDISIHAPRAGCDRPGGQERGTHKYFYPRTPGGVRLLCLSRLSQRLRISIHAPRAGCDLPQLPAPAYRVSISIHAPRAGCDFLRRLMSLRPTYFYPRTPGGVRPGYVYRPPRVPGHFYPRTPGGVRPLSTARRNCRTPYFYPRTPGGVRRGGCFSGIANLYISIHAPRAGCDCEPMSWGPVGEVFLSTHPGRGATLAVVVVHALDELFLSTHPGRGAT